MSDEEQARRARAEVRRLTWTFERLTPEQFAANQPWPGYGSTAERLERLEQLRQIAFALRGIDYPETSTPRDQRAQWPLERIG